MYCRPSGADNHLEGYVDNEEHFLTSCSTFTLERNCLFSRLESVSMGFLALSKENQTATLLCPTSTVTAKLVNRYIQLIFNVRKSLDEGVPALNLGFKKGSIHRNIFFDNINDTET